jgi:hypothetical protein
MHAVFTNVANLATNSIGAVISSLKLKQVKKITLHSILADLIKICCLEIVS